jgi:hypothetical protein
MFGAVLFACLARPSQHTTKHCNTMGCGASSSALVSGDDILDTSTLKESSRRKRNNAQKHPALLNIVDESIDASRSFKTYAIQVRVSCVCVCACVLLTRPPLSIPRAGSPGKIGTSLSTRTRTTPRRPW